jgi:hypothetical protein
MGSLPNLLVIGAKKAGTTALHEYLDLHPQIEMSRPKELDFFTNDHRRCDLGPDWYASHFQAGAPVRGESTPSYSSFPSEREVPERIASLLPDVKLIYLVRDPVERAVSDYMNRRLTRRERRPLAKALLAGGSLYLARSRYALQLSRYLEHFPPERILVVQSEQLRNQRRDTLRRVFAFLGVDETFGTPMFDPPVNEMSSWRPVRTLTGERLVRAADLLLGSSLSASLRARTPRIVWQTIYRPAAHPRVSKRLRAQLEETLRPDTLRLRELTGQTFAGWSV